MNACKMVATVAMVGFLFAVCAQAKSADSNMPKEVVVKGKVEVKKDAAGTITSVEIKSWDKTYHVTLDAKGMELGAMEGKHVEATGMLMKKEHEHWLTVVKFEEHKAKEKEKEKEKTY
jgi:hypothetical protein